MQFLYMLEKIRVPWLNGLMQAVTELGSETAFLAVALILFWCVSKREAYYLMSVGFIGTIGNQFLKIMCQVPRPWVRDPSFTIVESAREGASGYSFPSGHSQTSVGTFGTIAMTTRKKWVRNLSIAVMIIVPFSRMYLGVHYPSDVLTGAGMALALLVVLKPICLREDGKHLPKLFLGMAVLSVAYLAFAEFYPFPADTDPANLASAQKNAYTLFGTMLAMTIVYFVDEKKLHFSVEGPWQAQVGKVAGGLVIVLLIKSGLKAPVEALCGGHMISRSIRYFLVVLVAGIVWPMTFPWFAKWGKEKEAK